MLFYYVHIFGARQKLLDNLHCLDCGYGGISPGLLRISLRYTGTTEQGWNQLFKARECLGVAGADSSAKKRDHAAPKNSIRE